MRLPDTWIETVVGSIVVDIQPGFAQKPGEEDEGTTPQIRTHNITPAGKISLEGIKHITASAKELKRYTLAIGDVVFNNTNSDEWVGKTALFDVEGDFVYSNHMTRLRAHRDLVKPEFLALSLHFLWSIGYSKTRAKRWVSQSGIESSALASLKLSLPTLPEQGRIVEVLRQAEGLSKSRDDFDDLVTQTKRQLFIELFDNPIPQFNSRWPVVRLGDLVDVATGGTPSREQFDSYGGTVPWVKSTDLKDDAISSTDECLSELGIQRSNARVFPKETVLLAMYGQGQTRGRTGKLLIEASCNQACAALLPNDELLPDYLWIWFQLSYHWVRSLGRGGQQENLNLDIIRRIKLPKPPVHLQEEFSRQLAALRELSNASRSSRASLDKLFEVIRIESLKGDATALWRSQNDSDIVKAANAREELLRERGLKIATSNQDVKPTPRSSDVPFRLSRAWLTNELSEFQLGVFYAFSAYADQPLLAEDPDIFARFCDSPEVVERLEPFGPAQNNRIRRTLSQLSALGLIAKVTLPKQNQETGEREYLKAFRPLREEEFSRLADAAALRNALGVGGEPLPEIES
jgi:type I restriction enzyme S subunit